MKKIVFYLLVITLIYLLALAFLLLRMVPEIEEFKVGLLCAVIGGLGGCFYCLRAVYLNVAVRKQWGSEWSIWYYLRPLISAGSGAVSYLFLRAGLLVLESGTGPDATEIGFYALAFIAGFNVDKFIKKMEEISEAVWGIEKPRARNPKKPEEEKNEN